MSFQNLLIENLGAVRRITVNRPDKLNALNAATLEELTRAFEEAGADVSVRVVILRGAGDKAFVAGADISELATVTPVQARDFARRGQRTMRTVELLGKPVIAQIGGYALGGGMELAIGCDLIVAAAGAKFGQPEIKLAVFPPVAAVLLPRLVSPARALELLLGGDNILAEEAERIGLINRVFPRASFAADVQSFVAPYLGLSRAALVSARKAIRAAADKPFAAALDAAEAIYLNELMHTEDAKEGLAAFLEKRQPVWRNQ